MEYSIDVETGTMLLQLLEKTGAYFKVSLY
jgi:hypothetical protein